MPRLQRTAAHKWSAFSHQSVTGDRHAVNHKHVESGECCGVKQRWDFRQYDDVGMQAFNVSPLLFPPHHAPCQIPVDESHRSQIGWRIVGHRVGMRGRLMSVHR